MPNIEGLQWFLQNIWPEAYQQWPLVRLHIAGRNTPDWLKSRPDLGITVHGEVPDAADFINQHPLMVVPLLSGSGMRAKILEGMALGKVVITTRLGLEGIDAEPGRDVLVADNLGEFRQALGLILQDPQQIMRIGERARTLVAARYDSTKIGERLLTTYQQTWVDAVS
jgi:glycosyltransferase involved in cell wall biosynthesis